MFDPGATAFSPSVRRSAGVLGRRWTRWAVGAVLAQGVACGAPNPRILDSTERARGIRSEPRDDAMTERDKIAALIEAVRRSEHVFIHDDIERDGEATADKLQLLLERDPNGVRSAREFIERIAAPTRTDEPANRIELSDEESMLAKDWYAARLAELEGRPAPPTDPEEARRAEEHARRLAILDALRIVEMSSLRFVAPPRAAVPKPTPSASKTKPKPKPTRGPKRKPKRKVYDGSQFADMLRKKWEYLGADIDDLDSFVKEIASSSFSNMVRYRVVHDDGREQDFAHWLREQLDGERARLARGGPRP